MVAMTMANTTEEPILSRMDRLDTILRQLEEIRGSHSHSHSHTHSPKSSSCTSSPTRTSGTLMSDGGHLPSSAELISPESLEKHCRPIEHVMMETDAKGSLIERLDHVEDRVLKLCVQLEEEFMEASAERKRDDEAEMVKRREREERAEMTRRSEKEEKIVISEIERTQIDVIKKKKKKKKGLKELVKQVDNLETPYKIPLTTQEFWIQVKGLPLVLMTQAMGEEIERPLGTYITTDCNRGGDCLESAEDLGGIGCVQTVTVRDEDEILGWQWGLGMGGFKKSGSGTTRAPLFQEEDTVAEDFMPNDYPGDLAFLSLEAVKRVEQLEF
ncbi:hypothetical protein EV1_028348 [Malus domestica]